MKQHDTKLTLGRGRFEVVDFPPELSRHNGLLPLATILDYTVGEEVALYWVDRTPFVTELAAIRPFQMILINGLFRSSYGPLMWMLFYVPNPVPEPQPFAMVECHLNPASRGQVDLWRRLSNQTHWHLTLLGKNNRVADFFEFENVYLLGDALDTMEESCCDLPVTDFMRAKQEFSDRYTLDELYQMG